MVARVVILMWLVLVLFNSPASAQPPAAKKAIPQINPKALEKMRWETYWNAEWAQGNQMLTGVESIDLCIEPLPAALNKILDVQQLRTAVEIRCRSLGLRVSNNTEYQDPFLYLHLNAVQTPGDGVAYDVSVTLEKVMLAAPDLKSKTIASIWEGGSIHYVPPKRLTGTHIQHQVVSEVDRFLNDWMKANGR